MGRYIDWDDVVDRYPLIGKSSNAEEVSSAHIFFAEYELDSMLTNYYTTPFSSNNITAKDLSIDLVYIRMGNFKLDGIDKFKDSIHKKVEMLINGSRSMMLDDSTIMTTIGNTIWSSTMDYHPVFDHGVITDMLVSSSQLLDEENAKL